MDWKNSFPKENRYWESNKEVKKMEGLKMKYFVLNPHKKNAYGEASRKAIMAYAKEIKKTNAELAIDLRKWVTDIEFNLGLVR